MSRFPLLWVRKQLTMTNYSNSFRSSQRIRAALMDVLSALLVLLFSYAALSKLFSFSAFRAQMQVQPFPLPVAQALAILLPFLELLAASLLIFKRTAIIGLWLSFALMLEFTGYAGLALLHFWGHVPCSCGGILGKLPWGPHLALNSLFLVITIMGLNITYKERRTGGN